MAIRTSQINLVDLAGSEGVSKTRSEGIRFREGSNINKSLLALSKVIQRLSACQSKNKIFINYRDSKLTRILQPSLGGNSQTIVICTLSQLFCNYQESVKTLLFGQMAKNIRTIVNVNEVVKNKETIELKVAKQENEELKEKIYLLETKIKELSKIPETKQRTTPIKDNKQITEHISDKKEEAKDIEMEIECKENEVSNISVNSVTNSSAYLKEQIAYLHSKIFEKSEEIDRKDATIRKILAEKSEIEQKFEIIEIKETEARRELEHLREEAQKHKSEITIDEICKEMEDESKHKSLIEADGIKCFSFSHEYLSEDSNILSSIENQEIKGSEHESCNKKEKELKRIIVNQEKNIKKLNKELDLLTDNCHNMKDEIRCIAESERLKTDDLECAEKEISRLNEDIKFYQETNKELMNSIDEVERALHEFEECQSIPINTDNSASESSHQKASKRILSEENERLKLELANLQNEFRQQTYDSKQLESDLQLAEKSLETAESNIEILNETLEFMSNENIHFKDQLSKQKEALIYKRKEKHSLESDLEEIKKKFTQKKRTKKMEEKEQEQIKEKDLLMQECKDNTIEQLKDQLVKKEKEYVELKQTIDKVKRIQGDFDSMLKKEKVIFKEEFEKEKKALMQEIDEYKFKSYNVLNDNVNLKKKIKSLNNTILDKEIELKTLKQDKEKYMSEIVDLKVKIKQMEKEEQDKQHEIDEYKKESLVKLNKAKTEIDIYSKQIIENSEMIQNYNKFAKDMNGVIKLLIKESSEAIEYAREIPELSSDKNECYKTLLEQKAMLLKVERKIILKRQSGFKMPNKLEQKLKMGSSEEEHTTTDEYHHVNMERKKVKIVE